MRGSYALSCSTSNQGPIAFLKYIINILLLKRGSMSEETVVKPTDLQAKFDELVLLFNALGKHREASALNDDDHAIVLPLWQRTETFLKQSGDNVMFFMKLYEEAKPVLEDLKAKYEGQEAPEPVEG